MSAAVPTSSRPVVEINMTLPQLVVESMRSIVRDSFDRLALVDPQNPHFDLAKAIEALKGGIWLTTDYIKVTRYIEKETNQKQNWISSDDALKRVLFGFLPTSHWERKSGLNPNFCIKSNVSPSEAIDAAVKGPTLIDCGRACQIAMHRALRDYIRIESYDKEMKGKLTLGFAKEDPLLRFLIPTAMKKQRSIQISTGKLVGFSNHADYAAKHWFGSYQSYNLIYAGGSKYLGLGLNPEGVSKQELTNLFVKKFNEKPSFDLDGLASQEECRLRISGLLSQGKKPITENIQITERDIPGIVPNAVFELNLQEIENQFPTR